MIPLIFAFVLAPIVSMYIPLLYIINNEYKENTAMTSANSIQSTIKVHEILMPPIKSGMEYEVTHDSTYVLGLDAIGQYVLIVHPL